MGALPRAQPGPPPLRAVPRGDAGERQRLTHASAWTVSSMIVMSVLRLGSQMALSYLCLPEHFGAIALMRTFLTFVEMTSDMGIRGAIAYHPKGEEREFLSTAFGVQFLRGLAMWLLTCLVAWPAAAFYGEPLLLFLLPIAGLESVNNGLLSVRVYVEERRLRQMVPTLLDVFALVVSILTSVGWALYSPGAWALAAGPLFGGLARAALSHWWYRRERVPLGWNKDYARELFGYSRWILGSTMVSFVAQQFHVLYLGKFLPLGVLGVYQLAWSFCSQASKPMTALANRVIIPHYAELNRRDPSEHRALVKSSLDRFLPACLAAAVGSGLFAPVLFGVLYDDSFAAAGPMGILFAIVVWFMILQHVPRSALLSLGESRGVAGMSLWNAVLTVVGIVGGYHFGGGSITGAILGNALGNVAGCAFGAYVMHQRGLHVLRPMSAYSLLFLVCLGAGVALARALVWQGWLGVPWAFLVATVVLSAPLALWVWRSLRPAAAR
ncbi:MAG: hypothetical protein EXS08_06340 [Planctomycetes bacterium]|nr:hypothetical protein [Planctomycetota bacterium]